MRVAWLLAAAACGTDAPPLPGEEPGREREVIVDVPRGLGTVIYQSGTGPWQLATRLAERRYGFDLDDYRYGVAIACADDHAQVVEVVYATVDERRDVTLTPPCGAPPRAHEITGAITNLFGGEFRVSAAGETAVGSEADPTYRIETTPGVRSLLFKNTWPNGYQSFLIRRDLAIDGDVAIDLDAGRAIAGETVSVPELGSGRFITGDGSALLLDTRLGAIAYPHPDEWRAGDRLSISATRFTSRGYKETVTVDSYDPDMPPTNLFAPTEEYVASVVETAGILSAQWTEYDDAVQYGARVAPACEAAACYPQWILRASPERALARALSLPTETQLRMLGAWDDRFALIEPLRWSANALAIGEDSTRRATRTVEASFEGLIGGDLER